MTMTWKFRDFVLHSRINVILFHIFFLCAQYSVLFEGNLDIWKTYSHRLNDDENCRVIAAATIFRTPDRFRVVVS